MTYLIEGTFILELKLEKSLYSKIKVNKGRTAIYGLDAPLAAYFPEFPTEAESTASIPGARTITLWAKIPMGACTIVQRGTLVGLTSVFGKRTGEPHRYDRPVPCCEC